MSSAEFQPGWLRRAVEKACAEIASWPKEKQERMQRVMEQMRRDAVDPCICPSRCNEAQTCVGGCVHE